MKATELQIGDYIKYQGQIYIVEEISAKGWVHLIYPETKVRVNMTSDYIIDLLEPIPLTREILELNGFKYFKEISSYVLQTETIPIILRWDYWFKRFYWHEVKIRNVHELQHVLRMCDMNERANNFKVE